jgi:hypothetical protein
MGSVELFCLLLLVGGGMIALQAAVQVIVTRVRERRNRSSEFRS